MSKRPIAFIGICLLSATLPFQLGGCPTPPPEAVTVTELTVNEGANVTLNGSGSTGTGLGFQWTQINTPSVSLNGEQSAIASFVAPRVTDNIDLLFRLQVVDSMGRSSEASVTVRVRDQAPVANAGPDQAVGERQNITLSGGSSSGEELRFQWSQSNGTAVTLSGATTNAPSFTAPAVTTDTDLTFLLRVTDRDGQTAEDTVTITVSNTDPPLSASAGSDFAVSEGANVELDGSASTGAGLTFRWRQTAGPNIPLQEGNTARPKFAAPNVNADVTLTFELMVTDSNSQSASDSVNVEVKNEAATTASLSGALTVTVRQRGNILEAEPNDTPDTAHNLGNIKAGDRIVVLGRITALDSSDPFDGFHLIADGRLRITATLEFDDPVNNDLDMFVFEDVSMQRVELFDGVVDPEIGVFHARGAFDFVIQAFSGQSQYKLTLEAVAAADPIAEVETNDGPTQAQYLGKFLPGDVVRVGGTANASGDTNNEVIVAVPQAIRLRATLTFPGGGADYDILVLNVSSGVDNPTVLANFDAPPPSPEVGEVEVPGMTLMAVDAVAFAGSGNYVLTLEALQSQTPNMASAVAPAEAEFATGKNNGLRIPYGRISREISPGHAIVCGWPGADTRQSLAMYGCDVEGEIPDGPCCACFPVDAGLSDEDKARFTYSVVRQLCQCADMRFAEPNGVRQITAVPNDEFFNLQWHYQLINMPAAWDITMGSDNVIVAVIDTGIFNHPDLQPRIIAGFDMISSASNAADGDGPDADATDVGDLKAGGGMSTWHGTHVAGTVGAVTNNMTGIAGMTWMTRIMPIRVLGRQGGNDFDIANAILFAAGLANQANALPAQRAHIINMSLGGPGDSQIMAEAVLAARAAGVTVITAAGNNNSGGLFSPGGLPGCFNVSAVDLNKAKAPYSNFGDRIDIAAPGGDTSKDLNGDGFQDGVLSTLVDENVNPFRPNFTFYQGTSMAAPHVAGLAALLLAVNPGLTPDGIEQILRDTAEDLGTPGRDDIFGFGLINAAAAVARAQGNTNQNPRLGLSRQSINFGASESSASVGVSNLGGGTLTINSVTVTTETGGSWLTAALNGAGNAIDIAINRTGLAAGSYTGAVDVRSNGGNGIVQVVMTVTGGTPPPPGPQFQIFVLLVDADSGDVIDQVTVSSAAEQSVSYAFTNVATGRYLIFAGTDDDMDNFICDEGELCGAYPVTNDPTIIDLGNGEVLIDLNFDVTELTQAAFLPPNGEAPPSMAKRRLR